MLSRTIMPFRRYMEGSVGIAMGVIALHPAGAARFEIHQRSSRGGGRGVMLSESFSGHASPGFRRAEIDVLSADSLCASEIVPVGTASGSEFDVSKLSFRAGPELVTCATTSSAGASIDFMAASTGFSNAGS